MKARTVVSHAFQHTEFDGARKNEFQALRGPEFNLKFLKMHAVKKS